MIPCVPCGKGGCGLTSPQPFVSVVSSFFPIVPAEKRPYMSLKFRGVDFIGFDALLTDDELLVRDTARKFIEDNLIPIIEECNRAGRFPRELVKPMADL